MYRFAAGAAAVDETAPREKIGDGARRRPRADVPVFAAEHPKQFARAPLRVRFARGDQQLRHARFRLVGAMFRGAHTTHSS
jgi:hypothetical protein